jgi:hypothetical protein
MEELKIERVKNDVSGDDTEKRKLQFLKIDFDSQEEVEKEEN